MTTFTTDDRIYAEKDGSFTINCMPKPLTDEQISKIHDESDGTIDIIAFARAIEKAHGIG